MADGEADPPVRVPASATTPEAVICFMVGRLVAEGQLAPALLEPVVRTVLRREALGTTGIGKRLAVPHAACESIAHCITLIGRLEAPVDWSAVDDQPVEVVALVLATGPDRLATWRSLEEFVRRVRRDHQ